MKYLIILSVLLALASAVPFTAKDMHEQQRVGDSTLSPDGKHVVFSSSVWDSATNTFSASLYHADLTAGLETVKVTRLTTGDTHSDTQPVFGQDSSTVYYLREGQVWSMQLGQIEGTQYTKFPISVDNLKISSDGSRIAVTAMVYMGMDMAQTAAEDTRRAALVETGQMFTDTFVRHWAVWYEDKYSHVFVFDNVPGVSTAVDKMKSFSGNCPSQPFGDRSEFGFAPKTNRLGFSVLDGRNKSWRTNSNVYLVDSDPHSTETPLCVSCSNPGRDIFGGFDDDDIVYMISNKVPGYESDHNRLTLYNGSMIWLTDDWDLSIGSVQWCDDHILALVEYEGRIRPYSIDTISGAHSEVPLNATSSVLSAHWINNNAIIYSMSSFTHPAELFYHDDDVLYQITQMNDMSRFDIVSEESVWYRGADGAMIQGFLFKPTNYVEGQKYPLVMYIHGGPEGAWDSEWSTRWNPQIIVNQGYGLFAPNIHGSTGYGMNFTASIRDNWGGSPFHDIMLGLDYILDTYTYTSADQVFAMGASYGGYMMNWLQGHAPAGTFKAMLVHDGVFDLQSFWASTDELFFPEAEFGGPYYDNPDEYQKWSPSNYIDQWKFPMMVVHGGHDFRIPLAQGLGVFQSLQRRGLDSQFLYFESASHFVTAPPDSIQWHREIFKWFKKHQ